MSGADEVPDVITERVIAAVGQDYPEATAIMVVSEHEDGSASLSISGRKATEAEIISTLLRGIQTWDNAEAELRLVVPEQVYSDMVSAFMCAYDQSLVSYERYAAMTAVLDLITMEGTS